jgi:hypothetical protein
MMDYAAAERELRDAIADVARANKRLAAATQQKLSTSAALAARLAVLAPDLLDTSGFDGPDDPGAPS